MSKPILPRHSSLEGSSSGSESIHLRPSLFNTKDAFIERIAPVGVAAIYFGGFSLTPQDAPLSRQALFKLSFLHRHFLQPGGLRILVQRQTAILSGEVTNPRLAVMADILARQIEGIHHVVDETTWKRQVPAQEHETARESIQFLFATDQTLRSGVQVSTSNGRPVLDGAVSSPAQKAWAEQLAAAVGGEIDSKLTVNVSTPSETAAQPPQVEDESLQALVLFRLRLVRETEHLHVKVKANRGTVTLQGKVHTEGLRQRAENLARSTLGLRELRSTLSISA